MTRDDSMKRRLRAARPHPTPMFSGRVRQTLDRLPEQRKPSIFRFLPAAAMAAVAVVVIGLAVMSRLSPGGQNDWFQALAGGEEATATAEVTPAPTPEETLPTEQSAEETPIPTPAPEETEEQTAGTPAPTPTSPEQAITAVPAETTAMPGQDGDATKASDKGKIALGNHCVFASAQKSGNAMNYVIKGYPSDALISYFKSIGDVDGSKIIKLDPWVRPNLVFVLVDGLVDDSFVGTVIEEERLNLLIAANDDAKDPYGVFVQNIIATIQFSDNLDTFVITIQNENRSFRPTSNFTILTRYAPVDGGKVQYYALPVSGK